MAALPRLPSTHVPSAFAAVAPNLAAVAEALSLFATEELRQSWELLSGWLHATLAEVVGEEVSVARELEPLLAGPSSMVLLQNEGARNLAFTGLSRGPRTHTLVAGLADQIRSRAGGAIVRTVLLPHGKADRRVVLSAGVQDRDVVVAGREGHLLSDADGAPLFAWLSGEVIGAGATPEALAAALELLDAVRHSHRSLVAPKRASLLMMFHADAARRLSLLVREAFPLLAPLTEVLAAVGDASVIVRDAGAIVEVRVTPLGVPGALQER